MPIQGVFTLNSNEIFASIANMIISQEVFADNLGKHQTLVDKARVDGTLYGDTKFYYATDVLATHDWGNDAEADNLLALDRPDDPEVQSITIDVFKQIRLTIDYYLTKRAWSTEFAFSSFNSVMLGWMRETKKVYDGTTYNVYIGNTIAEGSGQSINFTVDSSKPGQSIAESLANLIVNMGDYNRDYNDYGYLRSYASEDVKVIWNSKYLNEIKKVDLPTIFHADGLVDKLDQDVLPARYFGRAVVSTDKGSGKIIGSDGIIDNSKVANGAYVHAKVEKVFILAGNKVHFFPGDKLPDGVQVGGSGHPDYAESEVYMEDPSVICKIVTNLPPYMSGFEVSTSFFNPRSLTENHYLTFGHNTLKYIKNYPFVTIKKAA